MEKRKPDPDSLDVIGHLDELRSRIFFCLGYLLAGTLIGIFFAKPTIDFLKIPAHSVIKDFVLLKPTEAVTVYFKVSLYAGLLIASPGIAYQLWQFVKPALPREARVSGLCWGASVVLLFLTGTAFAYAVLVPAGIRFLYALSLGIAEPLFNLNSYVSFVLSLGILGGLMFEMPVMSAFLTKIGILTPHFLRGRRKEAFFALSVLAAVMTPTTDIFNMLIFVLPMIVLYEVSILVSSLVYRAGDRTPGEGVYADAP